MSCHKGPYIYIYIYIKKERRESNKCIGGFKLEGHLTTVLFLLIKIDQVVVTHEPRGRLVCGSSTIGGGLEATTSPSSISIGGYCFGTSKVPTPAAMMLP